MKAASRATIVASLILATTWIPSALGQSGSAPGTRPASGGASGRPAASGAAAPAGTTGRSAAPATSPRTPASGQTPAAGQVAAAAPKGSAPAATVVVIDIGEVFKKHAAFNDQVEAIKKEMKDLEALVQTEQKKMAAAAQKLDDLKSGSPEYKKLEEELAHMKSDLQVSTALKQRAIMENEARVYYTTYTEICKQVEDFADRYGITLVLRHSNVQMDPQKRDSVFRGLERQIVFQRNLDITDEIISRVNQGAARAANAKPANRGPVQPASGVRQ